MIKPSECLVGKLEDASILTFLMPRTSDEETFLIVPEERLQSAIFLGRNHKYKSFDCTNNTTWQGLLIPNVCIELDEDSLFDPGSGNVPIGSLVRVDNCLRICVRPLESRMVLKSYITIINDLSPCAIGYSAGFRKWQIVLGEGLEKRILWQSWDVGGAAPTD